jgi:hypothetical protein
MSEDVASKRIQAARLARRFPALFAMLADGRLHLSAVVLLAPHLTPATADQLLAAAAHQTRAELEVLLAARFPRPDLPASLRALGPPVPAGELALGPVDGLRARSARTLAGKAGGQPARGPGGAVGVEPAAEAVCESWLQHAPGHVVLDVHKVPLAPGNALPPETPAPRRRLAPLSSGRFALQLTLAQETHDKLRYAQALLGHAVPSGDLAQVLDRALDALIARLEQRRFAAGPRSRPRHGRAQANGRYVPAAVRRAVWRRDGGRCTFVSERGRRCAARTRLEFDHIEPMARGGESTVTGLRLRCRAHNQYEAERRFGCEFMRHKRERARHDAAHAREARQAAQAPAAAPAGAWWAKSAAERAQERDVIPWLRALGFRADEARRAAARCEAMPDASLEERVRLALSSLAPNGARRAAQGARSPA